MNLVKLITDQLSADTLGKLGSLLDVDSDTVDSAAGAAIPSMLAGLAGLASQDDGARKLTSVLGGLDDGMLGNFDRMLTGDAGGILQKGGSLLSSLFGDSLINSLCSAISRFSGLNSGTTKSLLSYLLPLVLGKVATQWRSQGGTAATLKNMFADQKRNIADAVPSGFSLQDVPGLARIGDVSRSATRSAEAKSRSLASTLLPLALLALGAFVIWSIWQRRPEPIRAGVEKTATEAERITTLKPVVPDAAAVPEITRLTDDLTGMFKSVGDAFSSIKDAASAETAMPQLEELSRKIDAMKASMLALPEEGRVKLQTFVAERIDPLKQQAETTLSLPGLSERIKAFINDIIRKLEELHIIDARQ